MKSFIIIFFLTLFLYNCEDNKLIIENPKDSTTTTDKEIVITGVVPKNHYLYINSTKISAKFQFSQKFKLDKKINYFKFQTFENGQDIVYSENILITVFRKFSKEEENIVEDNELARMKFKDKKRLAKETAWNKSKAGRIYKKHPEWSRDDCEKLADGSIWIGMNYEMVVYLFGRPNSKTPSNYGNGTSWQYCWYNYSPSCFYDQDNDGRIDAYN